MQRFTVVEKFLSIDGEGPRAGFLSVFIRLANCNLRCAWCDTSYAWEAQKQHEQLTADEISAYVRSTGVKHVTLTGGEPLIHKGVAELISHLVLENMVDIETNGSVYILPFRSSKKVNFIVDYKLPLSGEEKKMDLGNFDAVLPQDAYKFVVAGKEDLLKAAEVVRTYALDERTQVFFSPVFGSIEPKDIVEFLKKECLSKVRLQLQLHKIIWDSSTKGV